MTKTNINPDNKSLAVVCDVVVVNFNAGAYLTRCVTSVFDSNVVVNLIIVDNASSDDSIKQVKRLKVGIHTLKVIHNSTNQGFATAVNQGAREGESEFIFLLNPDCEIHPHTIANLIKEVKNCQDFGILGALVFNEDGTEQRGCRRLEPTFARSVVTALHLGKYYQSVNLQYDDLPEGPQSIDAVSGASMLIDRATFEEINGMDEQYFLHVEDLDICRRVREYGKKVYFTPNVSLFHHHGASSHAVPVHTEWHKHQGMLRYQHKFQAPNQNLIRSKLTRAVIYLNFGLSIARKYLTKARQETQPVRSLLLKDEPATIITGASSDLGQAVLKQLNPQASVIAVSRRSKFPTSIGNEIWFNWSYFNKVPKADFKGADVWVALSPVWSAPKMAVTLNQFNHLKRVIAISSTSISGKAETNNTQEQKVVQSLIDGESGLLKWAQTRMVKVTICRVSLLYGGDNNQNIAFIKRMIKWFRVFPMVSKGKGLRQPVHIDEVAIAIKTLHSKTSLPQHTYTLAGAVPISYRQMVEAIFVSLNRPVRFINLPKSALKRLVMLLSKLPGFGFINPEMITRLEQDLVYDIKDAERDFAYQPGKFRP